MKKIAALLVGALIAVPAVSGPVTLTFRNLSQTDKMKVSKVTSCGILSPYPKDILPGMTSVPSSTDCGIGLSTASVVYTMGVKSCTFQVTTVYTQPNYLFNPPLPGYWTPTVKATSAGGAICRVVSQDASQFFLNGGFGATFSMK